MKILEKTLNIADHELPRTIFAWGLLFIHRLGLVLGVTTLLAMFVTQFGINFLPVMILFQAILTIGGMLGFAFLNNRFHSKQLIPLCAFFSGLLLFTSTFFVNQPYVFFAMIICVTGIFLPQLTIFLANYIEDFFSPFECERTFPVIESAQTIGGIIAGLLISTLSPFIGSYKYFYIWILLLFLAVVIIFFFEPFSQDQKNLYEHQRHVRKNRSNIAGRFKEMALNFKEIKLVPFLWGLLIVFLLNWIFAHILEFQYTKLIDESVASSGSAAAHEEGLAKGLGSFHMLFYTSALIVQLLAASRIFRKLGTVGSFLLHSLVTFFSSLSLLLGFSYFTVILAKNNFELSGIVHKNAYEASYYALRHGTQRRVREFFEAFVYPLGTIIGTLIIIGLQIFVGSKETFYWLQLILVLLAIGMIVSTLRLKHVYTKLNKQNLLESDHRLSKLHAIEILAQKGHQDHLSALIQTLENPVESMEVKIKILEIFEMMSDLKTIPVILSFFNSDNDELVYHAVRALSGFNNLGDKVFDQGFSRFRVIDELKNLFVSHPNERIGIIIIRTLAALHYEDIVPYILSVMKDASINLQIACIEVCALFEDPIIVDYLLPFLKADSALVRAHTVASLWKFVDYREKLKLVLDRLFDSGKDDDLLAYSSVIGDIGNHHDEKKLLEHYEVDDAVLKTTIAYALFKLGNVKASKTLVHLLFSGNLLVLAKAKELLYSLKSDQKQFLQNVVRHEVSFRLNAQLMYYPEAVIQGCVDVCMLLSMHSEAEKIVENHHHNLH